jgi:hypothetical protein
MMKKPTKRRKPTASSITDPTDSTAVVLAPVAAATEFGDLFLPAPWARGENFLTIPRDARDEELYALLAGLRRTGESFRWYLGDVLVAIQKRFGVQKKQVIVLTFGVNAREAEKCAQVAWAFPWEPDAAQSLRRPPPASWSHHYEALLECGDPTEASRWVALAAADGWSVMDLREKIRAAKRPETSAATSIALDTTDLYRAVRRIKTINLTTLDASSRRTLKDDLHPLVEFWERL